MIVARLSLLYRNLYETLKTLPCFCYHRNFCTRLLHVNWGLRLYSSWEIRISSLFRACDQPNHSLSLLNLCNTFFGAFLSNLSKAGEDASNPLESLTLWEPTLWNTNKYTVITSLFVVQWSIHIILLSSTFINENPTIHFFFFTPRTTGYNLWNNCVNVEQVSYNSSLLHN